MFQFAGRVAVVTGGSSGIGRATALALAAQGARVFVGDRHLLKQNEAAFADLDIFPCACDVSQPDQVAALVALAASRGGRLDMLVNNAGVGLVKPIEQVSLEEWDYTMHVNLRAAFWAIRQALPHFRACGGGAVVNVASNAGLLPRVHDPVYSISKGALVTLTKSLALCLAEDRVRINAVCPGPVSDTGMIAENLSQADDPEQARRQLIAASPLAAAHHRMVTPDEVAAAVVYLVSDASTMVTGTALAIDGGKSLGVPRA